MSVLLDSVAQEQQQLETAVRFILEQARQQGTSQAEVSAFRRAGISVSTRLGKVETLKYSRDETLDITVYQGKCKGSASTSDLSEEAVSHALQMAIEISSITGSDPAAGLAPADLMATDIIDLDLYHPQPLDIGRFIALASNCEHKALDYQGIKSSDGVSVNSCYEVQVYGNSHGFLAGYPTSQHSLGCVLIAGDEQMQRDQAYSVARDFDDLLGVDLIADLAARKTLSRLNSQRIKTCQVPVIFDNEVSWRLLEHFAMAISGSNLYRRASFLLDSLDKKLFPNWLTIHENPFLPKGLGSSPFDEEGVKTVARDIVSQGRLQSYLLSSYAARRMGMTSTGHAGGRIGNWQVSHQDLDRAALLKKMGTGLLVTELMGQGVNIVTGDYSRGVAGFWIENGEIAYPVHEITIASNLKDIYANLVNISNDLDTNHPIATGSILVESMQIAGY